MTAVPFVEAYRCAHAVHYLTWGQLRGVEYGWTVTVGGRTLGTLDGYPISAPPRTQDDAVPWAAEVTGIRADQWIQRPARGGAYHTHPDRRACQRPDQ